MKTKNNKMDSHSKFLGKEEKVSALEQTYFLFYSGGRQSDVFGTKGAIAMLCLDILSQCPELSGCSIGRFGSSAKELLSDEEVLAAAAEYAMKGHGAIPSLRAGINLSSWRSEQTVKTGTAVA
jgi:hypothetical protein